MAFDKWWWESLGRFGLIVLIAEILAVAHIPNVIPPSFASQLGVQIINAGLMFPKLQMVIGSQYPSLLFTILMVAVATTMLLACSVAFEDSRHGDALMTSVFAVFCLAVTRLFYSEHYTSSSSTVMLMIAVVTMLTLSYRPLVQGGFPTITLPVAVPDGRDSGSLLGNEWEDTAFKGLCHNSTHLEECWLWDWLNQTVLGFYNIDIPESAAAPFAGETVLLTLKKGTFGQNTTLSINIPGGMWLVRAFWTERGAANPLAVFSNLFLIIAWILGLVAAGILIWPIRTMRDMNTRIVIPTAIQTIAKLASEQDKAIGMEDAEKEEDLDSKRETPQAVEQERMTRKTTLALHSAVTSGGAGTLIFEPRIFQAPFEYIVPQLQTLMDDTAALIEVWRVLSSYQSHRLKHDKKAISLAPLDMQDSVKLLSKSAETLQKHSKASAEELQEMIQTQESNRQEQALEENNGISTLRAVIQRNMVTSEAQNVAASALAWLHAYHAKGADVNADQKMINLRKTYLPWLVRPFTSLVDLLTVASPKLWHLQRFLYSLKVTIGCVALFAMAVFWAEYSDFAIKVDRDDFVLHPVFSGWQQFGFCFSWQATREGTVKKGIMRLVGTCMAGLFGYVGVIICSGTTDNNAEMNPYAMVAWIWTIAMLASTLVTQKGPKALGGMSSDNGYAGNCFGWTHALIVLDVYLSQGTKGDIVANRVTANLLGIAMAMLLSCVPPYPSGTDSHQAQKYLNELILATEQLWERFTGKMESVPDDWLQEAAGHRQLTMFLMKDADKLKVLPFFHVPGELQSAVQDLHLVESLLKHAEVWGHHGIDMNDKPFMEDLAQLKNEVLEELKSVQETLDKLSGSKYNELGSN